MTSRPMVLMYHGFTSRPRPEDPHGTFVTVGALRQQLSSLLDRGWRPLDADAYLAALEGRRVGRRRFLVTIDDGMVSFAALGLPVLEELGVPCALFLPAGLLGDRTRWLPEEHGEAIVDRAQVLQLAGRGVEIGGHGWDHTSMRGLPAGDLPRHTAAVAEELADVTGARPRLFAYPYGHFDPPAQAAVRRAGYRMAFSVHEDAGAFAVSRVDVNATDTPMTFRLKRLPSYRRLWRAAGRAGFPRHRVRALLGGGRSSRR